MAATAPDCAPSAEPRRQLALVDTVAIIVGIVIGSGLYETPAIVAGQVPNAAWLFAVWTAGGLLALVGALCYAELATAWPQDGGDYVYLSRAYGRPVGFLFAWSQFWVIRPGSIGAMAFVFARYATQLCDLGAGSFLTYAALAIVVLSLVNLVGVRQSVWTQNILSAAKLLGLLAVVGIGLLAPAVPAPAAVPAAVENADLFQRLSGVRLAMIFVLFTYGGWNDMAYVAAEVRHPQRNILRALIIGTLSITAVYLLVNGSLVYSLGLDAMRQSKAVAADVVLPVFGAWGARAVSLLVCVSALGAINGMLLTGARIYYAFGKEHALFAPLGAWSPRWGTPARSIVVQMLVTLGVAIGFVAWAGDSSGFERMVNLTTPLFWLFLMLTGISLLVLRVREPHAPRPFRVPGYPVLPLVFVAGSAFMVDAAVRYAIHQQAIESRWTLIVLAVGVVLAGVSVVRRRANSATPPPAHS